MESNINKLQKLMQDKNSDLKLDENPKESLPKDKEKKRVHKKPIALKDLENKDRLLSLKKKNLQGTTSEQLNTTAMGDLLDSETNTIFFKQWNKLEKGLKCNRVNHYLNTQDEYEFKNNEQEDLKKLLYSTINKGGLTKNTDVSYNKDDGKIIKINILLFNEKKRKFSFKPETVKKAKSSSKSKSNIERLLRR